MKRLSAFGFLLLLACSSNTNSESNAGSKTIVESTASTEPKVVATSVSDAMEERASSRVIARVHLKSDPKSLEPAVDLGQPVSLVYAKQNMGSEIVEVWHSGFWPNHRIVVLHEGNPPDMTAFGKSGRAAFSPRGPRDKNVKWQLKPGVVDVSEGNFDLATLFTLDKVGRYTVQVDYEEEVLIRSNVLPFWLTPNGTAALLEKLNGWDAEESDVIERPEAHPGRIAAGESNGFIDSHKDALAKLGVSVRWHADNKRYHIASIQAK